MKKYLAFLVILSVFFGVSMATPLDIQTVKLTTHRVSRITYLDISVKNVSNQTQMVNMYIKNCNIYYGHSYPMTIMSSAFHQKYNLGPGWFTPGMLGTYHIVWNNAYKTPPMVILTGTLCSAPWPLGYPETQIGSLTVIPYAPTYFSNY